MVDYPEFKDEFTEDMRQIVVGNRVYTVSDPLPSFHPDMVVGSVANWSKDRVIIRVSDVQWEFATKE